MSSETDNAQKYEVGYGKPPKSRQFKKGESGNPSGSSAARRKAKPEFGNPFQEKLAAEVEIQEKGKTVSRTRKHLGVRRLIEAAANGDLRALREMLDLQKASDPSPSRDDYFHMGLVESLVWAPPEVLLHRPDTIVIRRPQPGQFEANAGSAPPKARKRKSSRDDQPRDQTWKSLVLFELERSMTVTDRSTGKSRVMKMRDVILEQLALAFAGGKKGAMKLTVRFNEMIQKRKKKLIPVVYIPHNYVIPPKCDDERGWPPGHEYHDSTSRVRD